jgi:hypothetical protein
MVRGVVAHSPVDGPHVVPSWTCERTCRSAWMTPVLAHDGLTSNEDRVSSVDPHDEQAPHRPGRRDIPHFLGHIQVGR